VGVGLGLFLWGFFFFFSHHLLFIMSHKIKGPHWLDSSFSLTDVFVGGVHQITPIQMS